MTTLSSKQLLGKDTWSERTYLIQRKHNKPIAKYQKRTSDYDTPLCLIKMSWHISSWKVNCLQIWRHQWSIFPVTCDHSFLEFILLRPLQCLQHITIRFKSKYSLSPSLPPTPPWKNRWSWKVTAEQIFEVFKGAVSRWWTSASIQQDWASFDVKYLKQWCVRWRGYTLNLVHMIRLWIFSYVPGKGNI